MSETWSERTEREIKETRSSVKRDIENGLSPTDAINRNAHTAETYSAMLKEHNLTPIIPD